jgi:hypothetical protein
MISKDFIGMTFAPHTVCVEAGRLQFFLKAIGETGPVYTDRYASHDAGYDEFPVPPTYLFCLELEKPDPFFHLTAIGVDIARVLHGEMSFDYYLPVSVGDCLTFNASIADIYDKKGGALEFIVIDNRVTNQNNDHVADLRSTVIQRNGQA